MTNGCVGNEIGDVVLVDRFELLIEPDGHRMGPDLGRIEGEEFEPRERRHTREGDIRLSTLKHAVKGEFDTIERHSLALVDADRISEGERELETRCLDLISEYHLPAVGSDLSHTSRSKTDKRIRETLLTSAIILVPFIVIIIIIMVKVIVIILEAVLAVALSLGLLDAVDGPLGGECELGIAFTCKTLFGSKADHNATRAVDKTFIEAEILEEHDLGVDLDLEEGGSGAMVGDHVTKVWLSRVDGRVDVALAPNAAELFHVFDLHLFAVRIETCGLDAVVVGDVCVDARFEDLKVFGREIA